MSTQQKHETGRKLSEHTLETRSGLWNTRLLFLPLDTLQKVIMNQTPISVGHVCALLLHSVFSRKGSIDSNVHIYNVML